MQAFERAWINNGQLCFGVATKIDFTDCPTEQSFKPPPAMAPTSSTRKRRLRPEADVILLATLRAVVGQIHILRTAFFPVSA